MSTALTWNEFRKLHKGTPQSEVSELWNKYKDGTYSFPVEGPSSEEIIESNTSSEVEEEPSIEATGEVKEDEELTEENSITEDSEIGKPEILQLCKDYEKALRKLELWKNTFTEEQVMEIYDRLEVMASKTKPEGYICSPTDSWKLWLGPTSECLLINTTRGVAFTVSRNWWRKYYQSTIYVDRELLNDSKVIDNEIKRHARDNNYVPRSPVVGVECKLPQGVKDIQLRGGQAQDL